MNDEKFAKRFLLTPLILLLLHVCSVSGQNEAGIRPINKDRFKEMGFWYDSSTAMYQIRYPILRSLPPINTGMPYDVLRSYLYFDSISRFDIHQTVERASAQWNSSNDTLRNIATHLYRMADHDPIAFAQYQTEVGLKLRSKYVASIASINENARSAIKRVVPKNEDRYALYSLIYTDYILRIRVVTIDSMLGKPRPSSMFPYRFRVTAQVLDTLKGSTFAPCESTGSASFKNDERRMLGATPQPCIQFQYSHGNYFHSKEIGSNGKWIYPEQDPEFMAGDGVFMMKPGQEAIVFLRHYASLSDSTADYFDINLEPNASYNALPVINGEVRDLNRIWSPGQSLTYAAWKERFYVLREKLLTGNY